MYYFCGLIGPVAQLNRVSDYGSEGYRFESCRGHNKKEAALYGQPLFLAGDIYNTYFL